MKKLLPSDQKCKCDQTKTKRGLLVHRDDNRWKWFFGASPPTRAAKTLRRGRRGSRRTLCPAFDGRRSERMRRMIRRQGCTAATDLGTWMWRHCSGIPRCPEKQNAEVILIPKLRHFKVWSGQYLWPILRAKWWNSKFSDILGLSLGPGSF